MGEKSLRKRERDSMKSKEMSLGEQRNDAAINRDECVKSRLL